MSPVSPFFSIIIPTFNSEALIGRCICSVFNQTFTDFEVLIMDGVSSDKTLDIILQQKNRNIRIYSEPDSGIYNAMNKGIRQSAGKWLYFLGSDDRLYNEQVLEKVHQILTSENCDILYGNVISDPHPGAVYDGLFTTEKIYQTNICHQAIFTKREVFKVTGYFNEDFKYNADWDHNMKWIFSSRLKNQYTELIISNYGAAGISSYMPDNEFIERKPEIYLKYGKRQLDIQTKLKLYEQVAGNYKKNGMYKAYYSARLKWWLLKCANRLKKYSFQSGK